MSIGLIAHVASVRIICPDFAYLCRQLKERSATVCIVGGAKTPDVLRNAGDQFFEYQRPEAQIVLTSVPKEQKCRPKALLAAVTLMASDMAEGWVGMGATVHPMHRFRIFSQKLWLDELSRMPLSSQQENDSFDGPDDRRNETKKIFHVKLAYPV